MAPFLPGHKQALGVSGQCCPIPVDLVFTLCRGSQDSGSPPTQFFVLPALTSLARHAWSRRRCASLPATQTGQESLSPPLTPPPSASAGPPSGSPAPRSFLSLLALLPGLPTLRDRRFPATNRAPRAVARPFVCACTLPASVPTPQTPLLHRLSCPCPIWQHTQSPSNRYAPAPPGFPQN